MKIVVFGDCMPIGPVEELDGLKYPYLLQKYFVKQGVNVEVEVNASSGQTSNEAIKKVTEVIEKRPDLVIINWGINDALPRGLKRSQRAFIIRSMYRLKFNKLVRLFFRKYFLNPLEWIAQLFLRPKHYVSLEETRDNFIKIIQDIKLIKNCKIILLVPNAIENYRFINSTYFVDKYNDVIKDVCDNEGVRYIDLNSIFIQNGLHRFLDHDKFHYNATAHKCITNEIINVLEEKKAPGGIM